ncbi:MAG: hypothetical protein JWL84_1180 [Rhodospirillales bacterium]|jgi:uncharacterized protein YjiS (DUF1127 family)|nr:hypothetical protein [Rhodospirillales bacterium]
MSLHQGLTLTRDSDRAPVATSWLRALAARIAAWRTHARESQELAQMSDRELQDIGLTRLDAEAFARGRY